MLPILLCAVAGASIVPIGAGLMTMGQAVFDSIPRPFTAIRRVAQGAVLFGLPALAGAALGGLALHFAR